MSAIVTTLRCNPAHYEPVFSFVSYHIAVGFSHIYLFVDHPSNRDLEDLLRLKFGPLYVTVFNSTAELLDQEREKCAVYTELEAFRDEVPVRQTINAEYAYHVASEQGYKWLLHIDIDELFYIFDDHTAELPSVDAHFDYLDSIGVQCMTYVNHEGNSRKYVSNDL